MTKAPLRQMLAEYTAKNAVRLHMPAHKGKAKSLAVDFDITELDFSDNLKNPSGAIAESQKIYAKAVNAKFCHYLVNGATAGLFAMAFCGGKNVLVESTCHVSLTNALKLAKRNIFEVDSEIVDGMPMPLTLEQIQLAVEKQKIDTVFITSPNYFGFVADLKKIFKFLKSRNITLFVDSAHGAHFGLSKVLPPNAVDFCNATVESSHKTLGSLTQSAVLLSNDEKLSRQLKEKLNLLTTTSPSFLLILSIEDAILFALENKANYIALSTHVANFRKRLKPLGFELLKTDDFTRLVLDCKATNMDARDVCSALSKQGIVCEYANERFLIAILSLFDSGVTLDAFLTALKKLEISSNQSKQASYIDACFEKPKRAKK